MGPMDDSFAFASKNAIDTENGKGARTSSSYTVRTDVAKDAMSKMAKLVTEIEESTCGVIDYGMVSYSATLSRRKLWKAMLSLRNYVVHL